MEGDGDDHEDDDIDQQEPLPRLTTCKEASYNCLEVIATCVLLLNIKDMDMKPCLSVQILIRLLT